MPEWLPYLVTTVIGLFIGLVVWLVVKVWPFIRKVSHFVDDVAGAPARPGVDKRLGLMERVALIEHEVKTNHGSSLKDAVKRIEATSTDTSVKLDQHIRISKDKDAEQEETARKVSQLAARWAEN